MLRSHIKRALGQNSTICELSHSPIEQQCPTEPRLSPQTAPLQQLSRELHPYVTAALQWEVIANGENYWLFNREIIYGIGLCLNLLVLVLSWVNWLALRRFLPWTACLDGGIKWLVLRLSLSPFANLRLWPSLLSLSLLKLHVSRASVYEVNWRPRIVLQALLWILSRSPACLNVSPECQTTSAYSDLVKHWSDIALVYNS